MFIDQNQTKDSEYEREYSQKAEVGRYRIDWSAVEHTSASDWPVGVLRY